MPVAILLALALLAGLWLSTTAAAAQSWYAGLFVGESRTDDALVANRESTIHDATNFATAFDGTDTAWRVLLGHRFHPQLAAEAHYASYGKTRMDTRFTVPLGPTQSGAVLTDREVRGFGADLVATWPVLEHFALLARVGWLRTETRNTTRLKGDVVFSDGTPGTERTNKSWENLFKLGLGIEWLAWKDASLRLEWERLQDAGKPFAPGATGTTGEADVDAYGVGIVWRFR